MQSEIRSNGSIQIRLSGVSPIERCAIEEMLTAADKGQTIGVYRGGSSQDDMVIELNTKV